MNAVCTQRFQPVCPVVERAALHSCWPARHFVCFAFDLASGGLATGRGISGVTTSLCRICGNAADSIPHFLAECPYLRPLRSWLRGVWGALRWPTPNPGADPRLFALFANYGWAPRVGDRVASMALQGAVLLASRAARYRLSLTGTPLAADDMVREAQTRLAFHIGLDWRCATQPDSFADDIQSVRPPTRQAFFERWGCVCRVNSGKYTLDCCIEPD